MDYVASPETPPDCHAYNEPDDSKNKPGKETSESHYGEDQDPVTTGHGEGGELPTNSPVHSVRRIPAIAREPLDVLL